MTDSRIQRLLAEVLLPLIGVIAWNWSFDFMCWFYAIDVFINALVGIIRHRRFHTLTGLWLPWLEFVVVILLVGLSGKNYWDSWIDFLAYKDMGIAQGYVLIPLVLLNEWMRWKLEQRTHRIMFSSNQTHLMKIIGFTLLGVFMIFVQAPLGASLIFLGVLTLVNLISKSIIIVK
jgi:hypothetical protein